MSADFDTRIPQKDIEECQRVFKTGGAEACKRLVEQKQEEWKKVPLNVAVIGNSGVGKSSFINAVRRLTADDKDKGAASVGVTETTADIKDYPHPNNPDLKFWDLPGVGTNTFPKHEYLRKIEFHRYDFFLLLTATRFTENDTWLGQEITKTGRKFFFVRTKLGNDLRNNKEAHPTSHDKLAVFMKINQDISQHLQALGNQQPPIFLIDSYKPQKFNFAMLEQRLIEDFPELKRSAMILSMYAYSQEMVRMKAEELRKGIWWAASLSGAVALVPLPGLSIAVDMEVVLTRTDIYSSQLGLDDDSLRNHTNVMKVDYQELKAIVDGATSPEFLTVQGITTLLQAMPAGAFVTTSMTAEEVVRNIPIIGPVIAGPISFGTTFVVLRSILNRLEEVALQVVTYASEHSGIEKKTNDNKNSDSTVLSTVL